MSFICDPKKIAQEVAEGCIPLSLDALQRFSVAELRTLKANLEQVGREVRDEPVNTSDPLAFQSKILKVVRVTHSLRDLDLYARQLHVPI